MKNETSSQTLEPKRVSESFAKLENLVLPPDTNYHNTIFGGNVMAYADKIASISAMRHCRQAVVTVRSDSFEFHAPIRVGSAIIVESRVFCAHRTSMEVFVKIESEDLMTGEKTVTSKAYLTMIAIDENGKPTPVPPVIPETEDDKKHYHLAMERYNARKRNKKHDNF